MSKISFRWVLLEVLDKISPGSVNWKHATKPPIKMPFRKVENCNQVIKIGKQLNFSLVNVAGNDIVQGNKKLILGYFQLLIFFFLLTELSFQRNHLYVSGKFWFLGCSSHDVLLVGVCKITIRSTQIGCWWSGEKYIWVMHCFHEFFLPQNLR